MTVETEFVNHNATHPRSPVRLVRIGSTSYVEISDYDRAKSYRAPIFGDFGVFRAWDEVKRDWSQNAV